jgi:hypothetical protein
LIYALEFAVNPAKCQGFLRRVAMIQRNLTSAFLVMKQPYFPRGGAVIG